MCLLSGHEGCVVCLGMYLRTTRRKNADGSTVEYHQLAENVWDAEKGCAVAKVFYNFGRGDSWMLWPCGALPAAFCACCLAKLR